MRCEAGDLCVIVRTFDGAEGERYIGTFLTVTQPACSDAWLFEKASRPLNVGDPDRPQGWVHSDDALADHGYRLTIMDECLQPIRPRRPVVSEETMRLLRRPRVQGVPA